MFYLNSHFPWHFTSSIMWDLLHELEYIFPHDNLLTLKIQESHLANKCLELHDRIIHN